MNIKYFDNYITASRKLCEDLKGNESLDVNKIVLVPDIYSLAYEKMLYQSGKGSFSINVRSVSRLFCDYCDGEVLSKTGAVLLIKKIAKDLSGQLTCFSASYKRTGFAQKMYDTISRLREQNIQPEALSVSGTKKNKLSDIKLIYSKYLEAVSNKYIDTTGKCERLISYFSNVTKDENLHIYVINYDVINPSLSALLDVLDEKCGSVTVYKAKSAVNKVNAKDLTVYKAVDENDMTKQIARNIVSDLKSGISADDICVVDEKADYHRYARVFNDYKIPFYLDKRVSLSAHPLAKYLLAVLSSLEKNKRKEDVLDVVKNVYFDASVDEVHSFCTYVNTFLINFDGFCKPFAFESIYTQKAEKVRRKLIETLSVEYNRKMRVYELKDTCKQILDKVKDKEVACEVSSEKAITSIIGAIETFSQVFANETNNDEFLISGIKDIFDSIQFSIVQQEGGVVQIGALNAFRGQFFKKIYIASFNDGVTPPHDEDCELITDGDIVEIEKNGCSFVTSIKKLNDRYKDELYQLLQLPASVYALYLGGRTTCPSYDLLLLERQFNIDHKSGEESYVKYARSLTESVMNNDVDKFVSLISTKANAIESLRQIEDTDGKYSGSLKVALGSVMDLEEKQDFTLTTDILPSKMSISRAQTYYDCPFEYFCKYTLGIDELKSGEMSALDTGNVIHAVLEQFMQAKEKQPVNEVASKIFDSVINQDAHAMLDANSILCATIKKEAISLCDFVLRQLERGEYKVSGCEVEFGKGKTLQPITVKSQSKDVLVEGKIDRIDTWGKYARVIDYKTGSANFSYEDIYLGHKIQLPLYMHVLLQSGFKAGGFFNLPLATGWSDDDNKHVLQGVYEKSDENMTAMDRSYKNNESIVIKTSGKNKNDRKPTTENGLDDKEIQKLCDYAVKMIQQAVENIDKRKIAPNPKGDERRSSCSYCAFSGICKYTGDKRQGVTASNARKYLKGEV